MRRLTACDGRPWSAANSILADLVEQRFVADLQQGRRLFAVPVGFIQALAIASASASSFALRARDFKPPARSGRVLRSRRIELRAVAVAAWAVIR